MNALLIRVFSTSVVYLLFASLSYVVPIYGFYMRKLVYGLLTLLLIILLLEQTRITFIKFWQRTFDKIFKLFLDSDRKDDVFKVNILIRCMVAIILCTMIFDKNIAFLALISVFIAKAFGGFILYFNRGDMPLFAMSTISRKQALFMAVIMCAILRLVGGFFFLTADLSSLIICSLCAVIVDGLSLQYTKLHGDIATPIFTGIALSFISL
jgi:hypothetical protein